MMTYAKHLCFLVLISIHHLNLSGQTAPIPCGDNAKMTSFCNNACLICDIDGFEGENDLQIQGQIMPEFCTTMYNNMSFIAFEAGTENLKIEIEVYDCNTSLGMEVGFFESSDCETFVPITECDTDIPANTSHIFENLEPLVVGQYYYLIMDGSNGTRCSWKFNVLEGSTQPPALENSGIIQGPSQTCPNNPTTYTGTVIPGAIFWRWSINGVEQPDFGIETELVFPGEGEFEVCVQAANVCDEADPVCMTVTVAEIEQQNFIETLCIPDVFVIGTETYTETGFYEQVFTLPNGCDSIVTADLTFLPQPEDFVDINICAGEAFFIGDQAYTETGVYLDSVPVPFLCDSLVNLDLFVIECEIIGVTESVPVICHGESTGQLIFSIENGTPPFQYTWEHITDPTIIGGGSTNLFEDNVIPGLPIGVYEININDEFGNDVVLFAEVFQPTPITMEVEFSDYGGVQVSCPGNANGWIDLTINGGVPTYDYLWDNGDTSPFIEDLPAGDYEVSVTDAQTCVQVYQFTLEGGLAPLTIVEFLDPNCDGFDTGLITIDTSLNGLNPYQYSLNGGVFSGQKIYEGLEEGDFELISLDARGCTDTITFTMVAAEIPIIELDEELIIELGYGDDIEAQVNNILVDSIQWMPEEYLECPTCFDTYAHPVNSTEYIFTAISKDGCLRMDTILVRVLKIRDFYTPNVFSPNGDGINETFYFGGGPEVDYIESLTIYDRWGNLVFEAKDFEVNDPSVGWNGKYLGKHVNNGVFVWVADVMYVDAVVVQHNGSITVAK